MVLGEPIAEETVCVVLPICFDCMVVRVTQLLHYISIAHGITALIKKYGPVMTLRCGSNVIIIIGRMDVRLSI